MILIQYYDIFVILFSNIYQTQFEFYFKKEYLNSLPRTEIIQFILSLWRNKDKSIKSIV